jgi:hypothetical protein
VRAELHGMYHAPDNTGLTVSEITEKYICTHTCDMTEMSDRVSGRKTRTKGEEI